MKQIDFTRTGGFPLTQDTLDYLQKANADILGALASARGAGPYILSGCVINLLSGGPSTTMDPGWIYYSGQVYYCAGGGWGGLGLTGTQTVGLSYYQNNYNLTYNDGSVHASLSDNGFAYGVNPDATITPTQFPLTALQPFTRDATAGSMNAASTGGTSGTIYYRKNWMANTLQLYGTVTISSAQSLPASTPGTGPIYYQVGALPAGYIPNVTSPISGYVRYHDHIIEDDMGVGYITQLNGEVDTTGSLSFGLIRPASGITTYSFYFNTIIPLD